MFCSKYFVEHSLDFDPTTPGNSHEMDHVPKVNNVLCPRTYGAPVYSCFVCTLQTIRSMARGIVRDIQTEFPLSPQPFLLLSVEDFSF